MRKVDSQTIKIACTGSGYFARFQYEAWRRIPGVEIVGAMARSISSAAETGAPPYDNLSTMLQETQPDLLDIITPPETHLEFIKTAVDEGIKRIICQKPFCRDLNEAKVAVDLCRERNVDIVIHENFRFQPWFRAIKRELDAGSIGDFHQITFRMRTGDGQGPDAYMERQPYFQTMPRLLIHETGVHYVDTFCFLLGKPDWVIADLRKMNPVITGEDAGFVVMGFADGRRALYDGNRLLDHASENTRKTFGECLVEGTEGTLQLTGDGEVTLRNFGETASTSVLPSQDWPGFAGDCVHALQAHVISGLRGNGTIENTAAEYFEVMNIVEAIYTSSRTGSRVNL